jgi:hypothetical protein
MADRDLNDAARLDAARANTTAGATGVDTDLRRLSDLDDFEVADGHPDIRGWTVKTPDGQTLGKVDDLVVSVREMRVRYMDVDVDRSVRSGLADAATPKEAEAGHALVPIGTATLDDDGDNVIVRSLSGADLASYPTYARSGGITRDYEQSLRGRFGSATGATTDPVAVAGSGSEFYENEFYDEARLYDGRRSSVSRDLGSSAAGASSAGDQARAIPVSREGTSGSSSTSGRDSVLRRRDSSSSTGMGAGAADRATNSGIADRTADRLDNLKDRVDGNPASKPGPDATDRPL